MKTTNRSPANRAASNYAIRFLAVVLVLATAPLCFASLQLCPTTFGFEPPTTLRTGDGPQSVAIGDFNGDGKIDFAVANLNSHSISIYFGNGIGGFVSQVPFDLGSSAHPLVIAAGEFNGDHKRDLVVATAEDTVLILLGDGSGGFAPQSPMTVGHVLSSVAVGDFDGDGSLDVAVGSASTGQVIILLGNGTGGFKPIPGISPPTFPDIFVVGNDPESIAVADINGDGHLDLIVANAGDNTIQALLGNGTDSLFDIGTPIPVGGTQPHSVAVSDFNGDHQLDLAVANIGSRNVSILLGDGTGNFTSSSGSPFATGSGAVAVLARDFDGDGHRDVAVANELDGSVAVLLGNGDGTFGAPLTFSVGSQPVSLAASNFDCDGKPDLAVVNKQDDTVSILLSHTCCEAPSFAAQTPIPVGTQPEFVALGDFNGNGVLDLAVANRGDSTISVLLGNGIGGFSPATGSPFWRGRWAGCDRGGRI